MRTRLHSTPPPPHTIHVCTRRDKDSQEVLARVSKLAGTPAHLAGGQPDLSDAMFGRLEAKAKAMHALKVGLHRMALLPKCNAGMHG